jgi:S1-C subfamily serine protease
LNQISELAPGKTVNLSLVRDQKPLDLQVTVGKRPKPQVPVEKAK